MTNSSDLTAPEAVGGVVGVSVADAPAVGEPVEVAAATIAVSVGDSEIAISVLVGDSIKAVAVSVEICVARGDGVFVSVGRGDGVSVGISVAALPHAPVWAAGGGTFSIASAGSAA